MIAEVQNTGLEVQEISPWKYLAWRIPEQTIRPQNIQLRTYVSNLQDLQQLLGEINGIRPILGLSNDELAPFFNLLREEKHYISQNPHT